MVPNDHDIALRRTHDMLLTSPSNCPAGAAGHPVARSPLVIGRTLPPNNIGVLIASFHNR
ncbi:hypothetical protein OPAG_02079 [Rhodococcus opacus PD630]|nr:hypothetical protein OPAG_02079 [Rhodococcus opacus PD630]